MRRTSVHWLSGFNVESSLAGTEFEAPMQVLYSRLHVNDPFQGLSVIDECFLLHARVTHNTVAGSRHQSTHRSLTSSRLIRGIPWVIRGDHSNTSSSRRVQNAPNEVDRKVTAPYDVRNSPTFDDKPDTPFR